MEPLAPLVDRMREIAREELPEPRACRITLWDDGTFDVIIYHTMGQRKRQWIMYERTTSEIVWWYVKGARRKMESFSGNETRYTPAYDESEVRVLETVEPPYE